MKLFYTLLLCFTCSCVFAQSDQELSKLDSNSLFQLSLEDLMNVKIVSASRKSESVFDAPVSSFVITKQDIAVSGALSIAEALKLCPGVIVREYSPGSYDVSIRGGADGLPTYTYTVNNTTILTMIDNRPIFNNFQGGTFWANLPITLVDVERIEIVLGASSPLYGPNAVSGVVNIITKKFDKKGVNLNTNVQYGINNSVVANMLTGYKFSDKLDVGASVNAISRQRTDIDYYDIEGATFVSDINKISNLTVSSNPNVFYTGAANKGHEQTGANFYLNYNPTSKVKLLTNLGYNRSQNLTAFNNTETQLTHFNNEGAHAYLKGDLYNFTIQASYIKGRQGYGGNNPPYKYDYNTTDLYIDYNINVSKNLTIKPALSFQQANIDDKKYTIDLSRIGAFNGAAEMNNYAASLKADWSLEKLRFIAAGRIDKFTYPDKFYPSYQFIINYKPTTNDNLRLIAGLAYQGSFIGTTATNFRNSVKKLPIAPGFTIDNSIFVKGSENLKLLQNRMYEIGYRKNFSSLVYADLSVTRQQFDNFYSYILNAPIFDNLVNPTVASTTIKFENIDLKAVQHSVTLSVSTSLLDSKLTLKPNITFQQTDIKNYSPNYAQDTNIFSNTVKTYKNIGFKTTPSWYGGLLASYKINSKFTVATQFYGFTEYQQTTNALTNNEPTDEIITTNPNTLINNKLLVNLTLHYKVIEKLTVFLNGRNLLNNFSREGFGTDKIGTQLFVGANFEY